MYTSTCVYNMGKSTKNIASTVKELLEKKINDLGYILWDVEYVKEASDWYLRLTIDNDAGITIEDCEKVHRFIDPILDEADPIENAYHLEVSSPGIEREIRTPEHFAACIGEKVTVKLFTALNGSKSYTGKLKAFEDNTIVLITEDDKECRIDRQLASKINTVFDI